MRSNCYVSNVTQCNDSIIRILYPSLRVEFPNLKRERVGDVPPGAFRPLRVEAEDLQIESDFGPNLTAKGNSLTEIGAKGSIGPLKQGSGSYPLAGERIELIKDQRRLKVTDACGNSIRSASLPSPCPRLCR